MLVTNLRVLRDTEEFLWNCLEHTNGENLNSIQNAKHEKMDERFPEIWTDVMDDAGENGLHERPDRFVDQLKEDIRHAAEVLNGRIDHVEMLNEVGRLERLIARKELVISQARKQGVTIGTARDDLKGLYDKLSTHKQQIIDTMEWR